MVRVRKIKYRCPGACFHVPEHNIVKVREDTNPGNPGDIAGKERTYLTLTKEKKYMKIFAGIILLIAIPVASAMAQTDTINTQKTMGMQKEITELEKQWAGAIKKSR